MEQQKMITMLTYALNVVGLKPDGKLNYFRILLIFAQLIVIIGLSVYLIFNDGSITYKDFTNSVETIITFTHTLIKYTILIINCQKVYLLIEQAKDMFVTNDLDENLYCLYKAEIRRIKIIVRSYIILVSAAVVVAITGPTLSKELTYAFYVPKWVPTWISLIFCNIVVILGTFIVLTLDTFSFIFISLLTLYMKILNQKIANLGIGQDFNDGLVACKIKQWVKAHIFFYSYFKILNSMIRWTVLLEVCIFIVSMSFELHLLVNRADDFASQVKSFVYLLALLTELFILYCWPGSKLTEEATDTLFYFYDTPWYKAPLSIQKSLLIIMTRLQRETVICVGNIVVVNMELFTNAFKASYSYFTALQTIKQVYTEE